MVVVAMILAALLSVVVYLLALHFTRLRAWRSFCESESILESMTKQDDSIISNMDKEQKELSVSSNIELKTLKRTFSGATAFSYSSWQNTYLQMTHAPIYLVTAIWIAFFGLPRAFASLFFAGNHVSDEDVINLLAAMITTISFDKLDHTDCSHIFFEIPADLDFDRLLGVESASVQLKVNLDTNRIVACTSLNHANIRVAMKDRNGVSKNQRLISIFIMYICAYNHSAAHVLSERSAREIAQKKVTQLEPSSRYVLALHTGLLHGYLSPLSDNDHPLRCFDHTAMTDLFEQTVKYPKPMHSYDPRMARLPNFMFYMRSRLILKKLLLKHNLDVNVECLFLNMIFHSTHHGLGYKALCNVPLWSFDGSGTLRSLAQSFIFTHLWLPHMHNPLASEYIRDTPGPFYQELYAGLKELDPAMADLVITSTSF